MCVCVCWLTVVEGGSKAPFSIATTPRCWVGCLSLPWIAQLTFDPHFIMLRMKKGVIMYIFWVFGMTWWDWTPINRTSGEHSNHNAVLYTLVPKLLKRETSGHPRLRTANLYIYIYIYICVYTHTYTHTYTHARARIYIYIYIYICVCKRRCNICHW